jgi:hypothetical protein
MEILIRSLFTKGDSNDQHRYFSIVDNSKLAEWLRRIEQLLQQKRCQNRRLNQADFTELSNADSLDKSRKPI